VQQTGKGKPGIALYGDFGPRAGQSIAVKESQPVAVDFGPRLLSAVPRLTRKRQQSNVMRFQVVLGQNVPEPSPGARLQVLRCFHRHPLI
jgi:hypothetical protein